MGLVVLPTSAASSSAGGMFGGFAVSSAGSGLVALGGVGVADPVPGAVVILLSERVGAGVRAIGINKYCPSRTA